jgi:hypothetical protein
MVRNLGGGFEDGQGNDAELQDQQQELEQQEQQQPQPDPDREHLDDDAEGILARAERTLGDTVTLSLHQRVFDGATLGEADVAQYASVAGVEPREVVSAIDHVVTQLRSQALKVSGFDQDTFNHFEAWASEHFPDATRKASRDQLHAANTRGIKDLAAKFAASGDQWHPLDVLEAQLAPGIETFRAANGTIMIRANGLEMTARDAIRSGAVRVTRVRR